MIEQLMLHNMALIDILIHRKMIVAKIQSKNKENTINTAIKQIYKCYCWASRGSSAKAELIVRRFHEGDERMLSVSVFFCLRYNLGYSTSSSEIDGLKVRGQGRSSYVGVIYAGQSTLPHGMLRSDFSQ